MARKDEKVTDFAKRAGISIGYASTLLTDDPDKHREPSLAMACTIFKRTGMQLGFLKYADTREAKVITKVAERGKLIAG